ncbi:MAG: hypothetical protein NZ903_03155 [Candidatus Micrarchaeota archaeon]|nr:hypothetical protein [Candidatus Micrarchaeota archaeon]
MAELLERIGPWAFVLGIILSIVLGLFPKAIGGFEINVVVLGILGIIVGLANITDKEIEKYILANIGFILAAASLQTLFKDFRLGDYSAAAVMIMQNIVLFVAPGLAVVCLREVYDVAKEA